MAYILETGNPYFQEPKRLEIVKITKTQIVTAHQRFTRPEKLTDGAMLRRFPKERFDMCTFTYREDDAKK